MLSLGFKGLGMTKYKTLHVSAIFGSSPTQPLLSRHMEPGTTSNLLVVSRHFSFLGLHTHYLLCLKCPSANPPDQFPLLFQSSAQVFLP